MGRHADVPSVKRSQSGCELTRPGMRQCMSHAVSATACARAREGRGIVQVRARKERHRDAETRKKERKDTETRRQGRRKGKTQRQARRKGKTQRRRDTQQHTRCPRAQCGRAQTAALGSQILLSSAPPLHVCMHVCTWVCMYACMHACMHVCMSVCKHVCMYVCMSVCKQACVSQGTARGRLALSDRGQGGAGVARRGRDQHRGCCGFGAAPGLPSRCSGVDLLL